MLVSYHLVDLNNLTILNNITYVIGVNGTTKRVTQIYPKKTYVNPY